MLFVIYSGILIDHPPGFNDVSSTANRVGNGSGIRENEVNFRVLRYLAVLLSDRASRGQFTQIDYVESRSSLVGCVAVVELARVGATRAVVPEPKWRSMEDAIYGAIEARRAADLPATSDVTPNVRSSCSCVFLALLMRSLISLDLNRCLHPFRTV